MCNNADKSLVTRYTKPEHIKNIINNVISKIKEKGSRNKKGEIEEYIKFFLGEEGREHIEIRGLKKGSLYISVDNSAWLQELSLMKQDLMNSINVELKDDTVKEIKIRLVKR